jgi:hypothetical protein
VTPRYCELRERGPWWLFLAGDGVASSSTPVASLSLQMRMLNSSTTDVELDPSSAGASAPPADAASDAFSTDDPESLASISTGGGASATFRSSGISCSCSPPSPPRLQLANGSPPPIPSRNWAASYLANWWCTGVYLDILICHLGLTQHPHPSPQYPSSSPCLRLLHRCAHTSVPPPALTRAWILLVLSASPPPVST